VALHNGGRSNLNAQAQVVRERDGSIHAATAAVAFRRLRTLAWSITSSQAYIDTRD
jgi:hypothetical protein